MVLDRIPERLIEWPFLLSVLILLGGLVVGYLLGQLSRRVLEALDVPESVEGTPFERTARSLGTSTVSILSQLLSVFIYGVALLAAIYVSRPTEADWILQSIVAFLPQVFIAALVLIVGFVIADKVELLVSEHLRSVKVPEVGIVPRVLKYSVLYVAFLIALGQVGVATNALLVLLGVYVLGVVIVAAVATKDLLASGAAGMYLLLNQPYGIGDEVSIGERSGVVQEMDVFVTRLEADEQEFIVPNRKVFEHGVTKRRA